MRHADGELLHVMGNIKVLMENGELIYQRFLLDITAQKLQAKKKEMRQLELIHALGIDYNLVCFFDLDAGIGNIVRNDDSDGHEFDAVFNKSMSLEESMEIYI